MTRKHFIALANILASVKPDKRGVVLQQWERDAKAIAYVCSKFNSGFDCRKFYVACGLESK